ncbi:histone-lysine N-methyltransferase eggless-like [Adelges cooleyi]|uniref:histone-lysine N-methyltransferase eggless-like n=1 Tax=Adelges cooleyi TaxID=133065 RepID=UPI0021801F92|nr:histone-lysine N-methyltransferase eggless-like [Adelges cooleyi]
MPPKCLNSECTSTDKTLVEARRFVCAYYNLTFKPYRRVCTNCLEISIMHHNRIRSQFKSSQCILNDIPIVDDSVVLSDDEFEENDKIVKNITNIETIKKNIELVLEHVNPVLNDQNLTCKKFLTDMENKLSKEKQSINSIISSVNNDIQDIWSKMFSKNQTIYNHREEIEIVEPTNFEENDVIALGNELVKLPNDLPEEGIPRRRLLKQGDKVYAMQFSLLQPWFEAVIIAPVSEAYFSINFCNTSGEKILNYKNMAYLHVNKTQYPVGTRVIAKFNDTDESMTDNFYAGIVAEPPKTLNNFRYMIFFDDGYTQYVYHKDIRLVCRQSANVNEDVHENSKDFVKSYLDMYPERAMVKFNKKQLVRAEYDKKWYLTKVIDIDASLVQLKFLDFHYKHSEWMYRGSNRLHPIYSQKGKNKHGERIRNKLLANNNLNRSLNIPYVEIEYLGQSKEVDVSKQSQTVSNGDHGYIIKTDIPSTCPRPLAYKAHQCNHFCTLWVNYNESKTKYMHALTVPLHFGFQRSTIGTKVVYTTPCGCKITNLEEMYMYLKATDNQMTIDFFDFSSVLNPLAEYKNENYKAILDDVSYESEFRPISLVNNLNTSLPPLMTYMTKRKPMNGVNMNTDTKFLTCCDCTDNCEDKTKCSCWQLTYSGQHVLPRIYKDRDIGYIYKRLNNCVYTGIYECNSACKCSNTCLNRVVQQPIIHKLQVFLTEKKGWGIRTLNDIPKGSFVSTYVGYVYTEKDVENDSVTNGDEYLADLDYIETVEKIKEDYESDVVPPEDESNDELSSDEEFQPCSNVMKSMYGSEMALRRRNAHSANTETNGKHRLSKLNTEQTVETKHKSIRSYFDNDESVFILDAKIGGNIGRYFNHSCEPNLFIQNVFVDTHDVRFPWVACFALNFIPAGTELTWDYGYAVGSVDGKTLLCNCESKHCRKRLL